MQIAPNSYVLKMKGVPMAKGEIMMGNYLAMGGQGELTGLPTKDPAFGLPAVWISETMREKAEQANYTVVDAPAVLATHITEFIKNNSAEIISRQDIKVLLDNLKKEYPAVVEEVMPGLLSLADVHKILANLLQERIPIRDLVSIMEALGDWASITKDPDMLTEYVRRKLAHQIGQLFADENGRIFCITLDPQVEENIRNSIQAGEYGNYLAMDPTAAQEIIRRIYGFVEKSGLMGKQIVVLVSPVIRPYLRKLLERMTPSIPVISYNEVPSSLDVESVGMVKI
jgi:flagellar biosynthesis protein FlhA